MAMPVTPDEAREVGCDPALVPDSKSRILDQLRKVPDRETRQILLHILMTMEEVSVPAPTP